MLEHMHCIRTGSRATPARGEGSTSAGASTGPAQKSKPREGTPEQARDDLCVEAVEICVLSKIMQDGDTVREQYLDDKQTLISQVQPRALMNEASFGGQ